MNIDPVALKQSIILTIVGMVVIFIFMGGMVILLHYFQKFAGLFTKKDNDQ